MANPVGLISKFIDLEGGVRASVVDVTDAVQEMQKIQQTFPLPSMFVGRSIAAAALMASHLKEDEMVSLYFKGTGPIEMVFAEATYEGGVRGYTPQPQLDLPLKDGRYDLGTAIGQGHLTVVRTHAARNAPYRGTVEIQTGEVGDDVAYYLQQSQQIRSLVSVGVKLTAYGQIAAAGGVLIELMPGADSKTEDFIEKRAQKVGSISELIESGVSHFDIVNQYLADFKNLEKLEFTNTISYTCRCSQDRLVRSMELLPVADLDEILKEKESIHAKCEFCGRTYVLTQEEAQAVRDKVFRNSLN